MKKIGVFTSGGDAPGMNACIRSVVRTALFHEVEVMGIYEGFNGLVEGDFIPLNSRDVSNILQRGGTILRSARSESFRTSEGRQQAFEKVKAAGIEGLIVIGGDGSFTGAEIFHREFGIPYIGVPGTIDNDLFGTDLTIGFDTACNTVVEAVDKIKDTAASHNRLFFVEVMGRDSGYIALNTGIAVGAEEILLPETVTDIHDLVNKLKESRKHKKNSSIVIVAEGDDGGGALEIAQKVKQHYNEYDTRVTILGHLQRGGKPSTIDRVLGSRLGHQAVLSLLDGKSDIMVGLQNWEVTETSVQDSIQRKKPLRSSLFPLIDALSI
ncbi:6-phosphofructokinase [bacterium SCSIO 12741]|nr:6-phosphofructokinase [bacterium SCSIO 12741]